MPVAPIYAQSAKATAFNNFARVQTNCSLVTTRKHFWQEWKAGAVMLDVALGGALGVVLGSCMMRMWAMALMR